jgi:hypothetical protein
MRPHSYYHDLGIYRPDVIVAFGFLSMLLQGSIFAAVYLRLAARVEPAPGRWSATPHRDARRLTPI